MRMNLGLAEVIAASVQDEPMAPMIRTFPERNQILDNADREDNMLFQIKRKDIF